MINTLDFYNKLAREDIFEEQLFDLPGQTLNIQLIKSGWVTFENCTINCDQLIFNNINDSHLILEFKNCNFNCNITFSNCCFDQLLFNNTKALKSLKIKKGLQDNGISQFNCFEFSNDTNNNPKLNTDFQITNTEFKKIISFENINHVEGIFKFVKNIFGDKIKRNGQFTFTHSTLSNIFFSTNSFNELITFNNNNFKFNLKSYQGYKNNCFFNNTFDKVSFSNSTFNDKCDFKQCDFLSTIWLENCENLSNSNLKFVACEFKGFSLFNNSKINSLNIERCTFDKSSSFTDAEFNILKLYEVKFGGGAYFDEMKINKVLDKSYLKDKSKVLEWKRTLRAIKQELQKTENKIDFNTYRNYELAAHYKELNIFKNFKDTSILWATKWSSNFGNWFWSLGFTIIAGLFFYSILYRIENSGTLNFERTNDYFVGVFRFFLVTDFYNPLENDRTYLENGWSWLIFILGKIFIAFGIYEMIQSFRKFKA